MPTNIETLAKEYDLKEETIEDLFAFLNREPGDDYDDSGNVLESLYSLIESIAESNPDL